jgi:GDPmannose 4,6-dehydratase
VHLVRRALVTGITGQDGSYLAELLLAKGYEVHGIIRRASTFNTQRIDHLYQDPHDQGVSLFLHYGDLTDGSQLARLIRNIEPDEIYNLAAQSHVQVSFEQPEYTGDVIGLGVTRLLEAIRETGVQTRLYQASSSEMFGDAPPPQSEESSFRPRSPYAIAKLYAHWMVRNYREAYGMYTVSGILFNHEGERRGKTFVTRKISRAVARIALGSQQKLYLGNIDAKRDWGHAKDYVEAIHLMLQQDIPKDYVIGTGEAHSVREFCELAFAHVGLDWERFVNIDPRYLRPTDVDELCADPTRAMADLGWKPRVSFEELVRSMVDADLAAERLGPIEGRARASSWLAAGLDG